MFYIFTFPSTLNTIVQLKMRTVLPTLFQEWLSCAGEYGSYLNALITPNPDPRLNRQKHLNIVPKVAQGVCFIFKSNAPTYFNLYWNIYLIPGRWRTVTSGRWNSPNFLRPSYDHTLPITRPILTFFKVKLTSKYDRKTLVKTSRECQPRGQSYKTFYSRNLIIFVLS